jgi:small-conductance mechanosensitive channel
VKILNTVFSVLFLSTLLFAENNTTTDINESITEQKEISLEHKAGELDAINMNLLDIQENLKNDPWYTKYENHQIYIDLENTLQETEKTISSVAKNGEKEKLPELVRKSKALYNQLELLRDFKTPPFQSLTQPEDIKHSPEISSPFDVFNGFAYLKTMRKKKEQFKKDLESLDRFITKLKNKEKLYKRLNDMQGGNVNRLENLQLKLDDIIVTRDIAQNTYKLYANKLDDNMHKTTEDITVQMKRLLTIALIIAFILLFSFALKHIVKRTISDNERFYMANKGINFTNFILILLVLLFSFLENVSYLVTVLGFVSAGLAFAMKDFFMSAFGWMVIVFGGSFHVGDRVKAVKNGVEYVGDIVDISILRMTILEDITLTSYMHNRRAGRIIFIPNNYIFTDLLANYTHGKIKTVWDGVDFMVTYDSNYKKAALLTKEIVKKYSKGYTDISRKQFNKLRSQYSLKNINVEPRIYTFMEPHGIKISCWYMTNSYATLTLRSNIFSNIIDAINEADDIKIAYPTQIINIKKDQGVKPHGGVDEIE